MHKLEHPKEDNRTRVTLFNEKDFDVSYFCGSGAGGQARNKVASGVQIIHRESGAIGRASDSRSQAENKRNAFLRLVETPKMKFAISRKIYELDKKETLEQTIEKETTPEKIKYEIKDATGKWEEVSESYFNSPAAKEQSD